MSDFGTGLAIGIAIGFAAGISAGMAAGKKQKPWSEMSEAEKKTKIVLTVVLALMAVLGIVVFLAVAFFNLL